VHVGLDAARNALHPVVEVDAGVLRLGEHRRSRELDLQLPDRFRGLRHRRPGRRRENGYRQCGKPQQTAARARHVLPPIPL
jgi:hypothetical protein